MPTVPSLKKKPSARKQERQKMYHDTVYMKARQWYMMEHPLCEDCLQEFQEGKISESKIQLAKDLHHLNSPFENNISQTEAYNRLRNPENFRALCRYHHEEIHKNNQKKN